MDQVEVTLDERAEAEAVSERSHKLLLSSLDMPDGLQSLLRHLLRAFIKARPQQPTMYAFALLATMLRERDAHNLDVELLNDQQHGILPFQPKSRGQNQSQAQRVSFQGSIFVVCNASSIYRD